MINFVEYRKFQEAERTFGVHMTQVMAFEGRVVRLPDGQGIKVIGYREPRQLYAYYLSKFGVVRIMQLEPLCMDKSELCNQLDEILIPELFHAASL